MEEYILINNINKIDHLRSIVRQDLRDIGVKIPKSKKLKRGNQSQIGSKSNLISSRVFGEHLNHLPTTFVEGHGHVPSFLVDASNIIQSHLDSEGIFRKSGSVNRQKELRQSIEDGKELSDSNIYDVSALVKQFFRELPEPLFSPVFHDAFIKCYQLPLEKEPTQAILQLCLCLPLENIGALRFMLHLLNKVASHSDKNKMTATNLALVMSPNFMHSNKGGQKMNNSDEKLLHIEVAIVEILINNCKYMGLVSSALCQQAALMSECFGTDDDLDASDDNMLENSNNVSRKKKRKRSGSLTGFVNSIASGIAKLRRSTDGKSINMSSNSTLPSELSINSNVSHANNQTFDSAATPCLMRKRRASGEHVPFSTNRKKAILGNLPQKSALASTPFTPASTVKRNYHDDSRYGITSETPRLNSTTPCVGSKTPRKKLNLFNSPGSNKKVKRQASVARMNSPHPREKHGRSKNIFRRLSGSREKISQESLSNSGNSKMSSGNVSPRSTVSDSVLACTAGIGIGRSTSSQSFQDSDLSAASSAVSSMSLNKGFLYETDMINNNARGTPMHSSDMDVSRTAKDARSRSADRTNVSGLYSGNRSKSVDSPGLKRGQPNTVNNGLPKHKTLDTSAVSGPYPVVVPVVPDGFDVGAGTTTTTPLRRSRRDEFEERKRQAEKSHQAVSQRSGMDKSICSQLDESLMGAVLPPPHGFGDQTMLEEESMDKVSSDSSDQRKKDFVLDSESVTGFSTISGGTVLQRTESGNYTNTSVPSSTLRNSISSCITSDHPLRPCISKDSVFSDSSSVYSDFGIEQNILSERDVPKLDVGKQNDDTFIDVGGVEDVYVSLRPPQTLEVEGEYATLKNGSSFNENKNAMASDLNRKGMDLLRESYVSEDESSSCFNTTIDEGMEKISSRSHIQRKKSISAEDLQSPRVNLPVRSRSLFMSPVKKFNYKPYLEISKETHKILARAGYVKETSGQPQGKDVQVPVKSPKRSSHREEMMMSLRASFHERINTSRLARRGNSMNQSTLSSVSSLDASQLSEQSQSSEVELDCSNGADNDKSLLVGCEKLSIKSESGSLNTTCDDSVDSKGTALTDKSPLNEKIALRLEQLQSEIDKRKEFRLGTETSEEEDSIQAKEPLTDCEEQTNAEERLRHTTEIKDVNKSLTLSGFLDQKIQLKGPLKIKGAELNMQRHDSVVNIKEQNAGSVAQNVKQFNHRIRPGKPAINRVGMTSQKRGTSPVRIPTIFAKNEQKAKQYREIAQFIRERTGQKDFMSLPQVPPTPKREESRDSFLMSNSISSEDESSESDQTVLEVDLSNNSVLMDTSQVKEPTKPTGPTSTSSKPVPPRLNGSLLEKVELLCASSKGSEELPKSPLQESTNIALSSLIGSSSIADNIRLRTAGGLTPHRIGLKSESLLSQRNNQRPTIKRLKGARSPRRVRPARSPHHSSSALSPLASLTTPSVSSKTQASDDTNVLTTVPICLEEKEGGDL